MKLGILRYDGFWDIDSFVADVAEAAEAGFSSYWIPNLDVQVDSLMALAIAGREVPGIELGAGIVPTWTRHPLVMGQCALTAASVIGDRLSLGVGVVNKPAVEHTWGLKFERPITYIREYLEVLRPVLAGEPVDYTGEILTARAPAVLPGAPQPGLYMAAMGEQMLKVAGRHSDGTILWLTGPKTIAEHTVPTITSAAEAVGRPKPRVLVGAPVLCTGDTETGRTLAAQAFGEYAHFPHYRAMLDIEGATGPEDIAAVGDESAVRDRLSAFFAAGADEILCAEFGSTDDRKRTRACVRELLHEPALR